MDTEDTQEGHRTESPMTDSRDVSQVTTRNSSPVSSTPPLTFLESSASPGYAPERRGPRSRATLPVPVPNLTKKSRGRRVPTQDVSDSQADSKDKRMYVCKVEGCGKCFHRGEHLKRHIRSIHTHEKPFMCTHPSCGKFFNRHDNLLQHLKVHKQNCREESGNPRPILKLSPQSLSPSPELEPTINHEVEDSVSESEAEVPLVAAPLKLTFPVAPVSYDPYVLPPRFEPPCESYTTNMAVSSLRTELAPHSPPMSRVRDSL
ncbi:Zinc finger protein MSN4 [Leucoagaricus sp. SymC.cos]|nr:Zinc finger protein MSN4 [Leucoagaricus sp. SymC.cos]